MQDTGTGDALASLDASASSDADLFEDARGPDAGFEEDANIRDIGVIEDASPSMDAIVVLDALTTDAMPPDSGWPVDSGTSTGVPDGGAPDSGSIAAPTCENIGTFGEGWYYMNIGALICWGPCANNVAECRNIGSRSEGWYASQGDGCRDPSRPPDLIEWTRCGP